MGAGLQRLLEPRRRNPVLIIVRWKHQQTVQILAEQTVERHLAIAEYRQPSEGQMVEGSHGIAKYEAFKELPNLDFLLPEFMGRPAVFSFCQAADMPGRIQEADALKGRRWQQEARHILVELQIMPDFWRHEFLEQLEACLHALALAKRHDAYHLPP